MAASAVMILHGFQAGSPVVANTGCCPSAAPTTPTPTFGTTSESSVGIIPAAGAEEPTTCVPLNRRSPLYPMTPALDHLRHGPSADRRSSVPSVGGLSALQP